MDSRKLRQQARVLRNKRMSDAPRSVVISRGAAKVSQPVPPPRSVVDTSFAQEMMRRRAEEVLKQRIELMSMQKSEGKDKKAEPKQKSEPKPDSQPARTEPRTNKGCAGCRRGK